MASRATWRLITPHLPIDSGRKESWLPLWAFEGLCPSNKNEPQGPIAQSHWAPQPLASEVPRSSEAKSQGPLKAAKAKASGSKPRGRSCPGPQSCGGSVPKARWCTRFIARNEDKAEGLEDGSCARIVFQQVNCLLVGMEHEATPQSPLASPKDLDTNG